MYHLVWEERPLEKFRTFRINISSSQTHSRPFHSHYKLIIYLEVLPLTSKILRSFPVVYFVMCSGLF